VPGASTSPNIPKEEGDEGNLELAALNAEFRAYAE
jgi:hypothetical protein